MKRCGVGKGAHLRVPSPFDYAAQMCLRIFPSPPTTARRAVVALVANAAMSLGGRTLVLTTTLRAIAVIAQVLRQQLAQQWFTLDVLAQGSGLKAASDGAVPCRAGPQGGCIPWLPPVLGGFDVPGDALQLVVIDKLPSPPGDPLVEARTLQIEQSGGSAFKLNTRLR